MWMRPGLISFQKGTEILYTASPIPAKNNKKRFLCHGTTSWSLRVTKDTNKITKFSSIFKISNR